MNNNLFIAGKIGTKEIAREDINCFLSNIKDLEWTDNNIYKPAKIVEVKPLFVHQRQSDSIKNVYQPNNINWDLFYVDENKHLMDFQQYKSDVEDRKINQQDKIQSKKKEFINMFFPGDDKLNENSDKKDILEHIKNNKVKLIINNENLNAKLGKYISYLNTFDFTQQPKYR